MSRNEEYIALLQELEQPPQAQDTAVERAIRRSKTSRRWRGLGIPVGSIAACFAGFVVLVNCFPTFAMACENIPLLGPLAEAVAWNKSLSAAVEHDYVQPIGQTQTINGVTATVEHVIVDRKQVSFFFTLDSDVSERLDFDYDIILPGDQTGYSSSTSSFGQANGELRHISMHCSEALDVPDSLTLRLQVYDNTAAWGDTEETVTPSGEEDTFARPEHQTPDYLAEFDFALTFDPYFTAQGEVIPVNTELKLEDQTLTLTEVELYPTHLRVRIDDDPANTAWLKGLDLYLENEHGEQFRTSVNGITATGDPDGEGYGTFWLDSPFFSQGEHLTLYITGAQWLEKDLERIRLDLENVTAEGLAESVRFTAAKRLPGGWELFFTAPREADGGMYQLFQGHYWDEAGNEYDIWQWGNTMGERDPETGMSENDETMFTTNFPLEGFEGSVIYMEPIFSHEMVFDEPLSISIK